MPNTRTHPRYIVSSIKMIKSNQRNAARASSSCARRSSVQINYKRKLSLFFTTPPPHRRAEPTRIQAVEAEASATMRQFIVRLRPLLRLDAFLTSINDQLGSFIPPIPRHGDKFIARIDFYAALLGLALSFFDAFQSIIVGSGRRRRQSLNFMVDIPTTNWDECSETKQNWENKNTKWKSQSQKRERDVGREWGMFT